MARDYGKGLIDPSFCCCAIPLVNAGIYAILAEQAVVSAVIGVLVFATPDIVGTSFPTFAGTIFAIVCFVVTACQPVGFIGVFREKTSTFKAYLLANTIAVLAAFSTAAALIIVSALKHNTAVADCKTQFFSPSGNSTISGLSGFGGLGGGATAAASNQTLAIQSNLLCNGFTWADVGIMGGLWLILLLTQGYFLYTTRTYSVSQVSDHKLYHSVYSQNPEEFTMSILRSSRYNPGSVYSANPPPFAKDDTWDARGSMDSVRPGAGAAATATAVDRDYVEYPVAGAGAGHARGESSGAMLASDQGMRNRESRYDDAAYDPYPQQQQYGHGGGYHGESGDYGHGHGHGPSPSGGYGYGGQQDDGYAHGNYDDYAHANTQGGNYPFTNPGQGYAQGQGGYGR